MTIIQGISDQTPQALTVPLAGGTSFTITLTYKPQQSGWFFDLSWNGNPVCNGQRLVTSPNVLRQYLNVIPFGILVLTTGNVEPTGQEDLSDGTTQLILLQGNDISLVETAAYGAPAGAVQAIGTSSSGSQVIVPPSNWGPASGDLAGPYPGPRVVAMHEGGGTQLTLGPIADGQFLKRVGTSILGTNVSGAGNVTGPGTSVANNFPTFANTIGTLLQDSGLNASSFLAANAAAGGDLAGTYPNPTIKVVNSNVGTFGTSTLIPVLTVNAKGQITAVSTVGVASGGAGTVTSITAGTGLSGGTITGSGTIAIANTGVGAGTINKANVTVNLQGQVTAMTTSNYLTGGLPWFFREDYGSLQAAWTATANSNGQLMCPPGVDSIASGGLVLPTGFTGAVGLKGCGRRATVFSAATSGTTNGNGIYCNLSAGTPGTNTVDFQDFCVQSTATGNTSATAGYRAITLDSGSTAATNEFVIGSSIRGVQIGANAIAAGGWAYGLCLFGQSHAQISDVSIFGSSANWATGAGGAGTTGLYIASGTNMQFTGLTINYFNNGVYNDRGGSVGAATYSINSQGLIFNGIQVVTAVNAFTFNGVSGLGLSGIWISDFLIDNGNISSTYGPQISITNATSIHIHDGQILVDGGTDNGIKTFGLTEYGSIHDVDIAFGAPNPSIHLGGTTSQIATHGNTYIGGSYSDSGTSNRQGAYYISGTSVGAMP